MKRLRRKKKDKVVMIGCPVSGGSGVHRKAPKRSGGGAKGKNLPGRVKATEKLVKPGEQRTAVGENASPRRGEKKHGSNPRGFK